MKTFSNNKTTANYLLIKSKKKNLVYSYNLKLNKNFNKIKSIKNYGGTNKNNKIKLLRGITKFLLIIILKDSWEGKGEVEQRAKDSCIDDDLISSLSAPTCHAAS